MNQKYFNLYSSTQTVEEAKADAERIKVIGLAEATAIGDVGKADAERMLAKAKVYKQYGDAAIMALVLEALPKVRKKLKQTKESAKKFAYS